MNIEVHFPHPGLDGLEVSRCGDDTQNNPRVAFSTDLDRLTCGECRDKAGTAPVRVLSGAGGK